LKKNTKYGIFEKGISLETLELATRLTEKHAPGLYKELEERRKSQFLMSITSMNY